MLRTDLDRCNPEPAVPSLLHHEYERLHNMLGYSLRRITHLADSEQYACKDSLSLSAYMIHTIANIS